jgi:hypothetical protein
VRGTMAGRSALALTAPVRSTRSIDGTIGFAVSADPVVAPYSGLATQRYSAPVSRGRPDGSRDILGFRWAKCNTARFRLRRRSRT